MLLSDICDNVYLVCGDGDGRFPYSFSVLIVGEKNVLIDTGCGIKHQRSLRKNGG